MEGIHKCRYLTVRLTRPILQNENVFKEKVNDDDPMDLGSNTVDLVLSDNIQERFHKLGIDAQLQVSVLSGLVKLSGSGSYLNEERKSARAARMSLIFKVSCIPI